MATAKKLPSGSWRCRVYSHTEEIQQPDGTTKEKKIYKSFTCDDPSAKGKRICEAEAASWAAEKEVKKLEYSITFGEALKHYIDSRENVLSPRTIMDYRQTERNHLHSIMGIKVDRITQEDIQSAINQEALTLSPKTVRNIHGLISAVLHVYRPGFALNTSLPKKKRTDMYIPTDEDVKKLMDLVKDTDMEIPILLAAFGPMRRGEICALEMSDINGTVVHVHQNMVRTEDMQWIIKSPKSYSGDRYIDLPADVIQKIIDTGRKGRIVKLNPNQITDRFGDIIRNNNMPHFRFHDLRHYSASILHAIGIPDVYIMQRGGWGNDTVLKTVYRHAMKEEEKKNFDKANEYFSVLYDTKYDTK